MIVVNPLHPPLISPSYTQRPPCQVIRQYHRPSVQLNQKSSVTVRVPKVSVSPKWISFDVNPVNGNSKLPTISCLEHGEALPPSPPGHDGSQNQHHPLPRHSAPSATL